MVSRLRLPCIRCSDPSQRYGYLPIKDKHSAHPAGKVVKDVWGWDPLSQSCWIALTERRARTWWTISIIHVPSLVASAVSLVAIATVLWRLLAMDYAMRSVFNHSRHRSAFDVTESALFRRVALRVIWYPCILGTSCSILSHAAANIDGSW